MERAVATVSDPISLIVDDGPHHPDHQLLSFSVLFQDLLLPVGLYIIEDIETSYWRRGNLYGNEFSHGLGQWHSTVEAFKIVADFVNRRFLDPADFNWLYGSLLDVGIDPGAADLVETVGFGRNAILIQKRFDPPSNTEQPPYAYVDFSRRQPRSATRPMAPSAAAALA